MPMWTIQVVVPTSRFALNVGILRLDIASARVVACGMPARRRATALRAADLFGMPRQASAFAQPVVRPMRLASACAHQTGNTLPSRIHVSAHLIECPTPMECASAREAGFGTLARLAACALASLHGLAPCASVRVGASSRRGARACVPRIHSGMLRRVSARQSLARAALARIPLSTRCRASAVFALQRIARGSTMCVRPSRARPFRVIACVLDKRH